MARYTQTSVSHPLVSEQRRKRSLCLFMIKIVGLSRGVMPIAEMAWFSRLTPSPDHVVEAIMRDLRYPPVFRDKDVCENAWLALMLLMDVGGQEIVQSYIDIYPDDTAIALEFEYFKFATRMISERRDVSYIARYSLDTNAPRHSVTADGIADLLFRKFGEMRALV